ncbi:hypothetical protein KSC_093440 [Ktedonobacter sp. SOSP1-52]|uniref:hypothetical protein n=1 Tax=Ktedonobacter sp. SOSP1-52 TaxID=2778366 RepID=UPI001914FED2|nr:hypothetical protein [Ktedonobacter sp. SOSP1-52]GHO70452.1 hypothetical protein KSC_093440 [Ktedonobacter sp. SOSP1-52]
MMMKPGWGATTSTSLFAEYRPPFDLTSDMLFVLAWCPSRALSQVFEDVSFLSLAGKTPLLLWFSHVSRVCYSDPRGEQHCLSGAAEYDELNVVAFLRGSMLFAPAIYATSDLTIQLGHGYGMPKQPTDMQVQVGEKWFSSHVRDGAQQSCIRARLLGSGKGIARLISRWLPRWTCPVRFPSGCSIHALLEETPRVQLAHIQSGHLALSVRWLPNAVRLFPLGCYVPGLRMRLPPPQP